MRLASKNPKWDIVPPANQIISTDIAFQRKHAPKMEHQHEGGYIVNTVSNPGLLLKHLAWEAYSRSQSESPLTTSFIELACITPEDVLRHVENKPEFGLFEYWNAGKETERVLGILPKKSPVLVKTLLYQLNDVLGRKVDWQFSIDEFGNFYLPKTFPQGSAPGSQPTKQLVYKIAEAALLNAKREDPTLRDGGINNRLPAEIEAGVNVPHVKLLQMRREQGEMNPQPTKPVLGMIPDID